MRVKRIAFVVVVLLLFAVWGSPGTDEQNSSQAGVQEELMYLEKERIQNPDLDILLSESSLKEMTGTGDVRKVLQRYLEGKVETQKEWKKQQASLRKIVDLGETAFLEIMPLVEFEASQEDLMTEAAVSYLIKTEKSTILFDLGKNAEYSHPSPLLHNMERLGVSIDDMDIIVISHNHGDHTGGGVWSREKTFSMTAKQMPLGGKTVYTPIPMTYPGLEPVWTADPTVVGDGIATTGVISNQMFFLGRIGEQALAVNVAGKGIVLITGCGHQTLSGILERAEALFDPPIYGLVGGLHYAVTGARATWKGVQAHRYFGTGRVPWRPYSLKDLRQNIALLKARNPQVVALSPHDSCDGAIAEFQKAFGKSYQTIQVGKKISIH